ncbi:MAG: ATP-binding cassette domain-containing protein, partial [Caldilineaceae bacterium]|nr:ATP-binding cassette domain-containing protein [Caldilineaceae bacterium]
MLTLTSVTKSYTAGQPVLRNITLDVAEGEVVCLLGPSGCGKSTLLRIIAGLEQADQGTLMIDGRELSTIPVHRRHFGLMFQDFALFPHRTVAENVAFGLRMAGMGRQAIAARVAEVLALVSLRGYEERSIFALSGGERQRV